MSGKNEMIRKRGIFTDAFPFIFGDLWMEARSLKLAADFQNLPRPRFTRTFKRQLIEILLEEAATVAECHRRCKSDPMCPE